MSDLKHFKTDWKPWEGVQNIELWNIAEDARNFYETEGGLDIEKKNAELMDSIKADGLMHPIVLRKNPEYTPEKFGHTPAYVIVSGHRRFIAFQRLCEDAKNNDPANYQRWETIPATFVETRDDLQARLMLLEANTTARDVTDWEKAKAVEEYGHILDEMKAQGEELEGRRRDHIAAALGMSRTNVGRFENINKNLSGEYREDFKAGGIGVSVADKIASLPADKQKELHDEKGADVKLADVEAIKEKPVIAEATPPAEEEKPVIHTVPLDVPKDKGYVEIIIAEQGGMFAGGYEAYTPFGGVSMDWKVSPKFNTYDEAFDYAVETAKNIKWVADLIAERPAEVNTSEDTSEDADGEERAEGNRIRLEGMRRAYAYLRKAANKFRQRADVEQQEGNEEEARYLNATADIFAELETVSFRSNVMETGADWGEFLDAATESTT